MASKTFYHRLRNGLADTSRATPEAVGSIARINRHTGKPHEHNREIARRQRQALRAS